MAKEIERKFLVNDFSYRNMAVEVKEISQGYVSLRREGVVRVRISGEKAFLTVKGINNGVSRDEWEYQIPVSDAQEMMDRVTEGVVLKKKRYIVPFENHIWEVDEYCGALKGLVIAEAELSNPDEPVALPPFIGEEVTGNPRYYNSSLASLS